MENQINSKPFGASMAKLVLIICVIFSFGAVLGVAGWVVKNKPVKIQQPQISSAPEPTASIVTYSPEEVWNNKVALENKQIIIEGIIRGFVICTKGPFLNKCSGGLGFVVKGQYSNVLPLTGKYNGKNIGCVGTDTSGVSCYPFEEEKKYRVTATFKKESHRLGDYYFLELQEFTLAN